MYWITTPDGELVNLARVNRIKAEQGELRAYWSESIVMTVENDCPPNCRPASIAYSVIYRGQPSDLSSRRDYLLRKLQEVQRGYYETE